MLMNRSRLSGGCARAFMNKYGVRVNFDQLLTKQLQFIPDTSSSSKKKIHNANKNAIICTQNISHRRLHLSVTKMFLVKINLSPVGIKFSRYLCLQLMQMLRFAKKFSTFVCGRHTKSDDFNDITAFNNTRRIISYLQNMQCIDEVSTRMSFTCLCKLHPSLKSASAFSEVF